MKIIGIMMLFLASFNIASQTVILWNEDFNTGAPGWTLNNVLATEGADPNFFVVNDNEGGVPVNTCGSANTGDKTLHLTSTFNPSGGAAYDAGGLCGILFCPETHRQCESPSFSTLGYSGVYLKFDFIAYGDAPNDQATVWYNDGTGWQQLGSALYSGTGGCNSGQGLWTPYSAVLPSSCDNNPNVQIALRWDNNDDALGTDPSVAINNLFIEANSPPQSISADFILSDSLICANECISFTDLSQGSIQNWLWTFYGADQTSSSLQNPLNVCYSTAGVYDVQLVVYDGSTSDTLICSSCVEVLSAPDVSVGNDTAFCEGDSLNVSVSGDTSALQWYKDGFFLSADSSIVVHGGGIYHVAVSNLVGCTDSDSMLIHEIKSKIEQGDTTVCLKEIFAINATHTNAGYAYSWSNGSTNDSTYLLPFAPTYFSLEVSYQGQTCYDSIYIDVSEISATLSANGPDCNDTLADISVALIMGVPPISYAWSNMANTTALNDVVSGSYSVTLTDSVGCVFEDSITLNPVLLSSMDTAYGPLQVVYGDTTDYICSGDTSSNYFWSSNGGVILSGNGSNNIEINWNSPGMYQISVYEMTDDSCFSDTIILDIHVLEFVNVNKQHNFSFELFPHPVKSQTVLEWDNNIIIDKIELRNVNGSLIKYVEKQTSPYVLKRGGLPSGVYLLQLHTKDFTEVRKVLFSIR